MRTLFLAALALLLAAPRAQAQDAPAADAPTLVALLEADGRFTMLVSALEATGLDATLGADGSFTVFAPTDEAFAALPDGALDALNDDQLEAVLLYHVLPGAVTSADASGLSEAATAADGQTLTFSTDGEGLLVGEARVVEADLEASNGVAHVVDAVLLPPADAPAAREDVDGEM